MITLKPLPQAGGYAAALIAKMAPPFVDALKKITSLVDLEVLLRTSQTATLFNVEILAHNLKREPPAELVHRKATLEETLTSTHMGGLPIINCVYEGSVAVLRTENRFFLTKHVLKWLDQIAGEKTDNGQTNLSHERDLAMRIAAGLRAFLSHATLELLNVALSRIQSQNEYIDQLTADLDETEKEVEDMAEATRETTADMNRVLRSCKRKRTAEVLLDCESRLTMENK
jgi:hypothetical protein